MCQHGLWPTSVSHPFSFLNSSSGLARGKKNTTKLLSLSLDLLFKNVALPVCFHYFFFYSDLLSLLSSGLFVIAVFGLVSL